MNISRRQFIKVGSGAAAGYLMTSRDVSALALKRAYRSDIASQGPLTLHGHPLTPSYAGTSDYPFGSAQTHWAQKSLGGRIGHTHVELFAPYFAEFSHASRFLTLQGRVQLFHTDGVVTNLWGPMFDAAKTVWETDGPIVGNPDGVVIRNFTVTLDMTLGNPDVAPDAIPQNGWFGPELRARTLFNDGARTDTLHLFPLWAVGDPNGSQSAVHMRLGASATSILTASRTELNGHGTPIAEYRDAYVPVAPFSAPMTADVMSFSYIIHPDFPKGSVFTRHVLDPDLHNGVAGTTLFERAITDPFNPEFQSTVHFDPAVMGQGAHKMSVLWEQNTGAGNATFAPNETLMSLFVLNVQVGAVTPPTNPPVDCAGTKVWEEVTPGKWHQVFTQTRPPANGGKPCSVVAGGGD